MKWCFGAIEDAYELPERLAVLWAYATGQVDGGPDGVPDGWLRCVVPNGDKNRSRWPTHPVWQLIQTAFIDPVAGPPHFGKIVRKRWEEHNIEKGIEAVMGYLTSLAAWAGGELAEDGVDLSVVLHWLVGKGNPYLERVSVISVWKSNVSVLSLVYRLSNRQTDTGQFCISIFL